MLIRKSMPIRAWDARTKAMVVAYWRQRGIVFADANGDVLTGKRGSLWGNLTSFDMTELIATLTVRPIGPTTIECVLDVNTFGQIISAQNEAQLTDEMDLLASYLEHGDLMLLRASDAPGCELLRPVSGPSRDDAGLLRPRDQGG